MSEMKLKVSEKGGVSLYGLGRSPVTLYAEQWQKLLGEVENIKKFLEDNKTLLKTKKRRLIRKRGNIGISDELTAPSRRRFARTTTDQPPSE